MSRERVAALVAAFEAVARGPMAGLPVVHPALAVEAVGFAREGERPDDAPHRTGILVTPWFMSLVRLPVRREDRDDAVGSASTHTVGGTRLEFIASHQPGVGRFETCSLFSPMAGFADQDTARAVAHAVLAQLRDEAGATRDEPAPRRAAPSGRRGFLLGRPTP